MGNNRSRRSSPPVDTSALLTEEEAQMVPTATLKPPVHIRRESLKLISLSAEEAYLTFTYDSYTGVTINCYFFAVESVKALGNTDCYYIDLEKYPGPIVHELSGGLNQQYPDRLCNFNLTRYTLSEPTFAEKKVYPLVIEIVRDM